MQNLSKRWKRGARRAHVATQTVPEFTLHMLAGNCRCDLQEGLQVR